MSKNQASETATAAFEEVTADLEVLNETLKKREGNLKLLDEKISQKETIIKNETIKLNNEKLKLNKEREQMKDIIAENAILREKAQADLEVLRKENEMLRSKFQGTARILNLDDSLHTIDELHTVKSSPQKLRRTEQIRESLRNIADETNTHSQVNTPQRPEIRNNIEYDELSALPSTFYIKETLNNIPLFNGNNLSPFIRACRRAINSVPRNLETQIVNLLKNKLNDHCYIFFENTQFTRLEEFIDRLKQIFSPSETLNNLRGKLDSIYRKENESIIQYINRILDIKDAITDKKRYEVGDLNDYEREEIERDIIEGFKDGLPPEFRLRLRNSKNMSLNEVIDEAITVEKQIERDNAKHGRNMHHNSH